MKIFGYLLLLDHLDSLVLEWQVSRHGQCLRTLLSLESGNRDLDLRELLILRLCVFLNLALVLVAGWLE